MRQYGKSAPCQPQMDAQLASAHGIRPFCNSEMPPTEAVPFRVPGRDERRNTQQEARLQRICLAGVCLALIFAGGEAQAADAKAPPMTASQKAAVDRAYAILQDTRDLQAMERLERRVPDQSRRGRLPRHF